MKGETNAVEERFRERPSPITSFRIQLFKLPAPVPAPQVRVGCSLQLFLLKFQVARFICHEVIILSDPHISRTPHISGFSPRCVVRWGFRWKRKLKHGELCKPHQVKNPNLPARLCKTVPTAGRSYCKGNTASTSQPINSAPPRANVDRQR